MFESLQKYLYLYKRLHIPGIGSFYVEELPSRLDFLNKQLHSPLPVIRFSMEKAVADRQFFDFLASDLGLEELQAIRKFNNMVFRLKEHLAAKGSIVLRGIGKLTMEFANAYTFQPANDLQQYYPEVKAERVIRKEDPHLIKVGEEERSNTEMQEILAGEGKRRKDKWWIFAVILALLGVAALVYYYYFRDKYPLF